MRVMLVVKGYSKDAYREADKLGLKLRFVEALRMDETKCETEADTDLLNRWFTRDNAVSESGDFPAGSLLYWAPIAESIV